MHTLYYIARKYASSLDRLHSEHRYVDTVACTVSLVFIRVDLRSVDTDRSRKAIGHYDTPVINSRPSSTYAHVYSCPPVHVRELIAIEKEETLQVRSSCTIYIFGRIYTAAIVYSLERIVSRPAERKPAYRPQATFASSN